MHHLAYKGGSVASTTVQLPIITWVIITQVIMGRYPGIHFHMGAEKHNRMLSYIQELYSELLG